MITKESLLTKISTELPDNANQEITASLLRGVLNEIVDSSLILKSQSDYLGLSSWSSTLIYSTGESVVYNGVIYQANVNPTFGTWNPLQWTQIAANIAFDPSEFILKTNGIELSGKSSISLSNNYTSITSLSTGYYKVVVNDSQIIGLDKTYPESGTFIMFVMSDTSNSNAFITLYKTGVDSYYYFKHMTSGTWVKSGSGANAEVLSETFTCNSTTYALLNKVPANSKITGIVLKFISGTSGVIFEIGSSNDTFKVVGQHMITTAESVDCMISESFFTSETTLYIKTNNTFTGTFYLMTQKVTS